MAFPSHTSHIPLLLFGLSETGDHEDDVHGDDDVPVCVCVRARAHVKPRKVVCESGLFVINGVIAELQPSQTLA